jgi:hypothetical protein
VPIVVVVGIAAIVGLVAFLIIQAGKDPGSNFDEAAKIEADPAPDLPGTYVNLPEIYQGFYGNDDGPNTAEHVTRDVDYVADGNSNPPVGGPHWGASSCGDDPLTAPSFCGPTQWGIYREPWDPESLVHNMEHGGLVLWYNTENQQVIDELEDIVKGYLDDDVLMVMTPYPDMEADTIAVTAWARIDKFPVSEYTEDRVREFIDVMKCRFNPETMPGAGCS